MHRTTPYAAWFSRSWEPHLSGRIEFMTLGTKLAWRGIYHEAAQQNATWAGFQRTRSLGWRLHNGAYLSR